MKPGRTVDDVRGQANQHYNYIVERPESLGPFADQAPQYAEIGRAILETVLALPEDGIFDLGQWLTDQGPLYGADPAIAFDSMPFLTGHCRILKWEFVHTGAGQLPVAVVGKLLESKEPVEYDGHVLTLDTVFKHYRRLPL